MNLAEVSLFDLYATSVAQGLIAGRYSYSSDQVLAAEVFRIANVMMSARQQYVDAAVRVDVAAQVTYLPGSLKKRGSRKKTAKV